MTGLWEGALRSDMSILVRAAPTVGVAYWALASNSPSLHGILPRGPRKAMLPVYAHSTLIKNRRNWSPMASSLARFHSGSTTVCGTLPSQGWSRLDRMAGEDMGR
jgi:hypothetical protein